MIVPIKIALAESSLIIRKGILYVLKEINTPHIEIVEVSGEEQFKTIFLRYSPDILIINPLFLGIYSLQQIKKDIGKPTIKVVALKSSLINSLGLKIYDETISIYDSNDDIKEKLIKLISAPKSDKREESLTVREKEVIVCIVNGMSNKQIADNLCVSTHTVITHRRNISTKLQIHSTAGLTIYAIANKLIDIYNVSQTSGTE